LPDGAGWGAFFKALFWWFVFWFFFVCDALRVFLACGAFSFYGLLFLAFSCILIGLFASPLCGAALTFFAAAKKVSKEIGSPPHPQGVHLSGVPLVVRDKFVSRISSTRDKALIHPASRSAPRRTA
jgi:hypothetical protein